MDELKKKIDLAPLKRKEIKAQDLDKSELWRVKDSSGKEHGPFSHQALKEYSHRYQYLFENCLSKREDEKEWQEFFSRAQYQRRKPQLISAENLEKDRKFYYRKSDELQGPYSQEEILEMLNKGEILSNIDISTDDGQSWIKLYQFHAFDRRNKLTNQDLPFTPEESYIEKPVVTEISQRERETQDALVGLAYIGSGDPSDESSKAEPQRSYQEIINQKSKSKPSFIWWKYGIVSAFALVIMLVGGDFSKETPIGEQVSSKVKSIDNGHRSNTKAERKPASVPKKKKIRSYNPLKKMKIKQVKKYNRPAKRVVEVHPEEKYHADEEEVESLDFDDPEVRNELTRQLASEEEGDALDEIPEDENYEEGEFFDDAERIEHSDEDY